MHVIEATFDGISLGAGRESHKVPPHFIVTAVGAAALVSLSCLGARLIAHKVASEAVVAAPPAHPAPPLAEVAANRFGALIVAPEWVVLPTLEASEFAGLGAEPPSSSPPPSVAEAVPPPSAPSLEAAPQPPESEVAKLEESAPLPPPRPPGFGEARPAPPRVLPPPTAPAAPADSRNLFQKLFGWGAPSTSAPTPAPGQAPTVASIAPESRPAAKAPAPPPPPAVAAAPPSGGRSGGGWFSFGAPWAPQGYDRQTAVYDISAHVVYMPDGSRLEAHSGLGDRLDDPRHVDERARGATPPHLYELTLREGSFHGVQAIRLNPVGEGGVYGRAGLLAHSYMLGPYGESNGCVSFKDYAAFLRAYENGQVKRLMVVASANQVVASNEPQSSQR